MCLSFWFWSYFFKSKDYLNYFPFEFFFVSTISIYTFSPSPKELFPSLKEQVLDNIIYGGIVRKALWHESRLSVHQVATVEQMVSAPTRCLALATAGWFSCAGECCLSPLWHLTPVSEDWFSCAVECGLPPLWHFSLDNADSCLWSRVSEWMNMNCFIILYCCIVLLYML